MSDEFEWFEKVEVMGGRAVGMFLDSHGNVGLCIGGPGYVVTEIGMDYDQAITVACALSHWAVEKRKRDREARDVRPQA